MYAIAKDFSEELRWQKLQKLPNHKYPARKIATKLHNTSFYPPANLRVLEEIQNLLGGEDPEQFFLFFLKVIIHK